LKSAAWRAGSFEAKERNEPTISVRRISQILAGDHRWARILQFKVNSLRTRIDTGKSLVPG
jgi:hypothetical protein